MIFKECLEQNKRRPALPWYFAIFCLNTFDLELVRQKQMVLVISVLV